MNGTKLAGSGDNSTWTELIRNDLPWEGSLVEAPWMLRDEPSGQYFLFYAGNGAQSYTIAVARASSIRGPYTKLGVPIMKHASYNASADPNPPLVGTGHCSVLPASWAQGTMDQGTMVQGTADNGNGVPAPTYAVMYHAWQHKPPVSFAIPRYTCLDAVSIVDAKVLRTQAGMQVESIPSGPWPCVVRDGACVTKPSQYPRNAPGL